MKAIDGLRKGPINGVAQNAISEQSSLYSDGSASYVGLHGFVEPHQKEVIPKEKTGEELP